jgi:hypothetical protein
MACEDSSLAGLFTKTVRLRDPLAEALRRTMGHSLSARNANLLKMVEKLVVYSPAKRMGAW